VWFFDLTDQKKYAFPNKLTRKLHVLPDHHGNRSPRANPTLRGMISGLKLSDTEDSLALLYLATVQAIANQGTAAAERPRSTAWRDPA